jgi:hypothetical protein
MAATLVIESPTTPDGPSHRTSFEGVEHIFREPEAMSTITESSDLQQGLGIGVYDDILEYQEKDFGHNPSNELGHASGDDTEEQDVHGSAHDVAESEDDFYDEEPNHFENWAEFEEFCEKA